MTFTGEYENGVGEVGITPIKYEILEVFPLMVGMQWLSAQRVILEESYKN